MHLRNGNLGSSGNTLQNIIVVVIEDGVVVASGVESYANVDIDIYSELTNAFGA